MDGSLSKRVNRWHRGDLTRYEGRRLQGKALIDECTEMLRKVTGTPGSGREK